MKKYMPILIQIIWGILLGMGSVYLLAEVIKSPIREIYIGLNVLVILLLTIKTKYKVLPITYLISSIFLYILIDWSLKNMKVL